MKIALTACKAVYNFCEPYIIAELGANHNGDMDLARKLIISSKEAGADCVKFQSWTVDSVFSSKVYEENCFLKDDYRSRSDCDLKTIVKKFSISEKQLLEMKRFSDEIGIDCAVTPFCEREVDFLVREMKVPFIKIASMDLNNYPFLKYIAKTNLPIVLSVGLSNLSEIDKAIRTIEETGNKKIVILHCVSNYPPKEDEVNLNRIESFQKLYPYPVGFSDHSLGYTIPLASVVKGACMIEKHVTLDKELFGWDHKVSATPDELKMICSESRRIQKSLGSHRITSVESEEKKIAFRRSIVSTADLKAGSIIQESDITYKRPGEGIAPEFRDFVVGRKVKNDIKKDKMILKKDLV